MKQSLCLLALALAAPLFGGCHCGDPVPVDPDSQFEQDPPTPQNAAPSIVVYDWSGFPPLGPDSELTVTLSDDRGLEFVSFDFRNHISRALIGTQATVVFTGSEIGEGFGTAVATAYDIEDAWTEFGMEGIVVDLSPPEVELLDTVVRRAPDSDIWLWTGDAFVLGSVTVDIGEGLTETYQFEPGYPETIGVAWDQSLVNFGTMQFPEGTQAIHVIAKDAAGNTVEKDLEVKLDGTPPEAKIAAPAAGASLAGVVEIDASATDAGDGPAWIVLSLGGTEIGTFAGPQAFVNVDVGDFAAGPTTLTAVAIDEAGNESAPVEVDVTIE